MNAPLYAPHLTTWKDDGKGNVTLVGDLAETPGTNVNNDCKVWEFKIKDGVKFEDGTADHLEGDRVRHRPLVRPGPHRRPDLRPGVAGRHPAVRHQVGLQGQQDLAAARA